ncbi:hypothetical protein AsGV080 [Agrotis segetum granulovirus]|uniref:Uncharacterized protein n=1 Tax=Agrotis segetum granulosis virus TaxID=10464 RepID=A0A023MIM7_GVAS|nr:hypothetical protein AsGV080 [Agrotis segetum granulovirus]AHN92119.1 hypothetical protein AsGV080 [Agrotis segetum granulovirus]AKN63354.1 hypothetical protein AsGV080 [Agrotis segetum granulovirus]
MICKITVRLCDYCGRVEECCFMCGAPLYLDQPYRYRYRRGTQKGIIAKHRRKSVYECNFCKPAFCKQCVV